MKSLIHTLPCMLMLAACAAPVVESQRMETVDGNQLQFTSGTTGEGRFLRIENVEKQWHGTLKGGKEKWQARATMLNSWSTREIRDICGDTFYHLMLGPMYNMMDKDDTMGGAAPVLGIAASMAAHLAASSATDAANIPISIYSEFSCRKDARS